MVVGDMISAMTGTALNTYHYYQPAASVEIMVTSTLSGVAHEQQTGLYDGANLANARTGYSTLTFNPLNNKLGINNSLYLAQYSNNSACAFTGIQIK